MGTLSRTVGDIVDYPANLEKTEWVYTPSQMTVSVTYDEKERRPLVYLAHPRRLKEMGMVIESLLENLGYRVWNPFIENEGETIPLKIFYKDLEAIKNSDFVLAILTGSYAEWGVSMEIMYAYTIDKRVILYLLTPSLASHPFLIGTCTQIFTSWRELEEFLKGFKEDVYE